MSTVAARGGVIYALVDPRNNQVRYIGQTVQPKKRLYMHLHDAKKRPRRHLCHWINQLLSLGLRPELRVLQECLPGMLDTCEQEWIAKGRAKGWRLCNGTDGGEAGCTWTTEAKEAASQKTRQLYGDADYRQRITEHLRRVSAARRKPAEERAQIDRAKRRRHRVRRRQRDRERRAAVRTRYVFTPLTHGTIAFVPLTRGMWGRVDARDWTRVSQHRWQAQHHHTGWRAKASSAGGTLLSRFVIGDERASRVRCVNGNQLDCTRANLSVVHDAV